MANRNDTLGSAEEDSLTEEISSIGNNATEVRMAVADAIKYVNDCQTAFMDSPVDQDVKDDYREKYESTLGLLQDAESRAEGNKRKADNAERELKIERERHARVLEDRQSKGQFWNQVLNMVTKDLASVVVGCILLIGFSCTLVALIVFGDEVQPDIIESAFLLVLGFFFGHRMTSSSPKNTPSAAPVETSSTTPN